MRRAVSLLALIVTLVALTLHVRAGEYAARFTPGVIAAAQKAYETTRAEIQG